MYIFITIQIYNNVKRWDNREQYLSMYNIPNGFQDLLVALKRFLFLYVARTFESKKFNEDTA